MKQSQIISLIVTLGAIFDTVYGVIAENAGLLSELGVSPKITKVIMLAGLLWTAFSKSLVPKPATFADGDGAGTPDKGL